MLRPLTPEQQEDILMSRSVMDEPRSMLQKILDFAWGRTLPEQMTSAFTGAVGPTWKLTPNAPSWLRRAFESGKREIPLQGSTPKRLKKVLEPEVVSTPSDEIPGNLLKQLGLPTRLEDARPGTPWHEALYWQRAMGGSEGPGPVRRVLTPEVLPGNESVIQDKLAKEIERTDALKAKGDAFVEAARRLGRSEKGGFEKAPYELPEAADELATLLEQLGGSYGPRKLPPVSGGSPSMFEKFRGR